eukprot:scaffold38920_cov15-Tisochrysis_lutea.AAC.1
MALHARLPCFHGNLTKLKHGLFFRCPHLHNMLGIHAGQQPGSNLLVHYLGLHAADPPPYAAAICVSNAFDLER